MATTLSITSWNMAGRGAWAHLRGDLALVQAAPRPPAGLRAIPSRDDDWAVAGEDGARRTAVVVLDESLAVDPIPCVPIGASSGDERGVAIEVSRPGTIAAAVVTLDGEPLVVASVYGVWEPAVTAVAGASMSPDAAAHRLAADLTALVGVDHDTRLLVAGDLNVPFDDHDEDRPFSSPRYRSVFDHFATIGLEWQPLEAAVEPAWAGGRPATLAPGSRAVPTFRGDDPPEAASRQIDHVFASRGLDVRATARNASDSWGGSDHCPIDITVTLA